MTQKRGGALEIQIQMEKWQRERERERERENQTVCCDNGVIEYLVKSSNGQRKQKGF